MAVAHVVGHLLTHRPMDVEEVIEVAEWSAGPIHEGTGEMMGQLRMLLEMPEGAFERGQGLPGGGAGDGGRGAGYVWQRWPAR